MKKVFKIFILLFLTLLVSLTYVDAFSINMNLEDYAPSNTTNTAQENLVENDFSENEVLNIDVDTTENEETDNSSPKITTTKNSDDEFLTAENVLSIIIIVVGILLVFLSVAILIRLR